MIGRLSSFFLIIGILLVFMETRILTGEEFNSNPSLTFPTDPFSFQPGSGQIVANAYCVICHSADYIYMQPPHSQGKWTEIIKKMKQTFGCPIPDESITLLSEYLTHQNEISPLVSNPPHFQKAPSPLINEQGSLDKGKSVYTTHCLNCHGRMGKGDGPIGKMLIPPAANLTVLGKKSDQELLVTIQDGRPGTAMPSWKDNLSAQEIADVLFYVRSFGQKSSKK
jgi:mono/diheme cytochrome c family protein